MHSKEPRKLKCTASLQICHFGQLKSSVLLNRDAYGILKLNDWGIIRATLTPGALEAYLHYS